jgi:hypothetical protein
MKSYILILLLLVFSLSSAGTAAEFWSVNTFQLSTKDTLKINLMPELRFKDQGLYYFQTYFGPALLINKNWEIDIYYAQNLSKTNGSWSNYGLGYLDLVYKSPPFSNRGRLEYNIPSDLLKYRDLLQFKWNIWCLGGEIFYNTKINYWDESRWSLSGSFKLAKSTELNIAYLKRQQRKKVNDHWGSTEVVSAGLKLAW